MGEREQNKEEREKDKEKKIEKKKRKKEKKKKKKEKEGKRKKERRAHYLLRSLPHPPCSIRCCNPSPDL